MLGADCSELYQRCPLGHGIFDLISVLGDQSSKNLLQLFKQ